jgi:hypothetical protein
MSLRTSVVVGLAALIAALAAPGLALAHGEKEDELAELAKQPARALAQQAIALIRVRGDTEEAAMRLDAAVESKDKGDIDSALLERAMETLDDGDADRAVAVLDQALSRPLGSDTGKALHEAGREFRPASGAQEIVAIALGAAALLLGLLALRPRRRAPSGGPLAG